MTAIIQTVSKEWNGKQPQQQHKQTNNNHKKYLNA